MDHCPAGCQQAAAIASTCSNHPRLGLATLTCFVEAIRHCCMLSSSVPLTRSCASALRGCPVTAWSFLCCWHCPMCLLPTALRLQLNLHVPTPSVLLAASLMPIGLNAMLVWARGCPLGALRTWAEQWLFSPLPLRDGASTKHHPAQAKRQNNPSPRH